MENAKNLRRWFMKTWFEFAENRHDYWENKVVDEKVCIILRGLPGSGKSTLVKELLKKYNVGYDHVFSSDLHFTPVANNIRELIHPTPENMPLNKAIAMCSEILKTWFGATWSKHKDDGQSAFIEFKKLFDKGEYYDALAVAKNLHGSIENVEYHHKWNPSAVGYSHSVCTSHFQQAVDAGVTPVIIDNTNVNRSACRPYVEYAKEAKYKIEFKEPTSDHWLANRDLFSDKYKNKTKIDDFAQALSEKNAHGVSKETILKMINKWHHKLTLKDFDKLEN